MNCTLLTETEGPAGIDDPLEYVRLGPGTDQPVLTTLAPITKVTATGRARSLADSFWYEINAGPHTGWVNTKHLSILRSLPHELDRRSWAEYNLDGDTVAEVARSFAEQETSRLGWPAVEIVISAAPSENQVTLDVIFRADLYPFRIQQEP